MRTSKPKEKTGETEENVLRKCGANVRKRYLGRKWVRRGRELGRGTCEDEAQEEEKGEEEQR